MKLRISQWANLKTREILYGIQQKAEDKRGWHHCCGEFNGVTRPLIYKTEEDAKFAKNFLNRIGFMEDSLGMGLYKTEDSQ